MLHSSFWPQKNLNPVKIGPQISGFSEI